MLRPNRLILLAAASAAALAFPSAASADHATRPHTGNVHALGHSPEPASFFGSTSAERHVSSDIAFWGNLAFHGNYDGFRIVDITEPGDPVEIFHQRCNGDQGDIVVWENILVRSWNSPAPAGRFCDGQPVEVGFEGVHVFDISNLRDPQLLAAVPLDCGSHTTTLVPDVAHGRLIVYSNVSSGCVKNNVRLGNAIDIIEVPLANPGDAHRLGQVPLHTGSLETNNGCHDAGVILGNVNLLACASGHAANVFSIGAPRGGTLENPKFLYSIEEEETLPDGTVVKVGAPAPAGQDEIHAGRWHSAAFTWDGKFLVLGWEPGGGAAAECTERDPAISKSAFFYRIDDGEPVKVGQWTLPRNQSDVENCTIHNYNVVPMRDRYILVSGNYQAGTWVADFTDPQHPVTLGWSDPGPLGQVTTPTGQLVNELGGAWSSYWYNNFIYESEITKGLNVLRLSGGATAGARHLSHLNPQTQEFSLG